jgi:hypothetical protein
MMTTRALTILLPLIPLSALSTHAFGQTDKPMTNQDVIKLVKLGLSSEITINKIEDSPAAYDLSVDGLTSLAQTRVPNEVIKVMQAAARQQGRSSSTAPTRDGTLTAAERGEARHIRCHRTREPIYGMPLIYTYFIKSTVPSAGTNFWQSITPSKRSLSYSLSGRMPKPISRISSQRFWFRDWGK